LEYRHGDVPARLPSGLGTPILPAAPVLEPTVKAHIPLGRDEAVTFVSQRGAIGQQIG
jgi:hypothetical protein